MGARIVECVASQQATIPCTLFAQRLHLLGIIFTLKQTKQVSQWIQMKQHRKTTLQPQNEQTGEGNRCY